MPYISMQYSQFSKLNLGNSSEHLLQYVNSSVSSIFKYFV